METPERIFAHKLIEKGVLFSLEDVVFSKEIVSNVSIRGFNADFSDLDQSDLSSAIYAGIGLVKHKEAYDLLHMVDVYFNAGMVKKYTLTAWAINPNRARTEVCEGQILNFTEKGINIHFSKKEFKETVSKCCDQGCRVKNKCPAYLAYQDDKIKQYGK